MKTLKIIIALLLLSFISFAQTKEVFTYSPDSSALTIILQDTKLNSQKGVYRINLNKKWFYKKTDSINIDIRGSLQNEKNPNTTAGLTINFEVFGKNVQKTYRTGEFRYSLRMPLKNILHTPTITIKARFSKEKKFILFLDSIDIAKK